MIAPADPLIQDFIDAGADYVSVHPDAGPHLHRTLQAIKAGADEGLMLDPHGFVATCNSTHFFIVRKGEVWTSSGDYCLGGITRGKIIDLCRANDIPVFERNFPLAKCYGANEAFTTGTFAGLAPVGEIDGRRIGSGQRGEMVERLQKLYLELIHRDTSGQKIE